MELNKSRMKNIKGWFELEPNFPGVATPQRSEWIMYIISYAYNPFNGHLGGRYNNNKHNMVVFYNKWKKINEIQITKNKMDLNKSKMKNVKA